MVAAPVIPGRHVRLDSTCSGIFGRGPIRLISPRSTFNNWGSSSSFQRRRKEPAGVKRLVVGRGDRMMSFMRSVDHGSEFQNGKCSAVTAHSLLQEENWTRRCEPH